MMRGYLKILVLKELETKGCSGYELLSRLKETLGKRPSPGSIYPLLKDLLENKVIDMEPDGNKKIYSLSAKGRSSIKRIMKEKEDLMLKHLDYLRVMGELGEDKENQAAVCLFEKIQADKMTAQMTGLISHWKSIEHALIEIVMKNKYFDNKAKVNKILEDADGKLRRMLK
ncbi:MAG: PadR family transcriptional regulator [Candidatus Woesearchaeota archaeon]